MSAIYPLTSVTSREQYLVQEHFAEVQSMVEDQYAKAFSSHAYAAVVDPKESRLGKRRAFPISMDPSSIGLVVCRREAVGLSPQPGPPFSYAGGLALQAGSFLDFVVRFNNGEIPRLIGFGSQRTGFINQVAGIVRVQVEKGDY